MSTILYKLIKFNSAKEVPKLFKIRSLCTADKNSNDFDVIFIGSGIIGMGSCRELKLRYPELRMAVVDKEKDFGLHQTRHNSGVIHAGIYYTPGSLKAKLCVEGMRAMYKYCDEKKIPYKRIGKLIVATDAEEIPRLDVLEQRGIKNEVPGLEVLENQEAIHKYEPHCRGIKALYSPTTGIVNYRQVTEHFGKDIVEKGGQIILNFEVNGFSDSGNSQFPVLIKSKQGRQLRTRYVLACAGLQSDLVAAMSGCPKDPKIIPFRGEYFLLSPEKAKFVKANIYPVPDPRFPFLGVHFTPRLDGSVWIGPNAVLALKREGYTWRDINLSEMLDALMYPGFRKLAFKFLRKGFEEIFVSLYPRAGLKHIQRYMPSIEYKDIKQGPAGIRAQALQRDGTLVEDFHFDLYKGEEGDFKSRILHCRNTPSPGATSSMAIARMMAERMEKEFKLK